MGCISDDKGFVTQFTKCEAYKSENKLKEFFTYFDKNRDNFLDRSEFRCLLIAVIDADIGSLDAVKDQFFIKLNKSRSGLISLQEFRPAWLHWLKHILDPRCALVVIDVQIDFISGTLALRHCPAREEAEEVVPIVNQMIAGVPFDAVVFTYDWHPADHISFIENVDRRPLNSASLIQNSRETQILDKVIFDTKAGPVEQVLWPAHCVQNSPGARLHPGLDIPRDAVHVYKGTNSEVDSYSAFFDNSRAGKTNLDEELKRRNISYIFVCGLATDVCVAFTANHGIELGYGVCLVEDASRGVDRDGIDKAFTSLRHQGGKLATSEQVPRIVGCKERPMELCLKAWQKFVSATSNGIPY